MRAEVSPRRCGAHQAHRLLVRLAGKAEGFRIEFAGAERGEDDDRQLAPRLAALGEGVDRGDEQIGDRERHDRDGATRCKVSRRPHRDRFADSKARISSLAAKAIAAPPGAQIPACRLGMQGGWTIRSPGAAHDDGGVERRFASITSQIIAATSGPPRFLIARMPVGEVTLISVRKPSITSMPTKISPRSRKRRRQPRADLALARRQVGFLRACRRAPCWSAGRPAPARG